MYFRTCKKKSSRLKISRLTLAFLSLLSSTAALRAFYHYHHPSSSSPWKKSFPFRQFKLQRRPTSFALSCRGRLIRGSCVWFFFFYPPTPHHLGDGFLRSDFPLRAPWGRFHTPVQPARRLLNILYILCLSVMQSCAGYSIWSDFSSQCMLAYIHQSFTLILQLSAKQILDPRLSIPSFGFDLEQRPLGEDFYFKEHRPAPGFLWDIWT